MNKKAIAIASAFGLSLAGCGGSDDQQASVSAPLATVTPK